MGTDSRHAATGSASAFVSLGSGSADASTRSGRGVLLSSKCRTTVLLLAAVVLAFGLSATPASSTTTASKALRFVVEKRATTYVIVERGSVRVVVKRGSTYVGVRGVPRYRVIKRASTYCLLMPIVSVVSYGAKGDGTSDDTTAIAKTMRAAVSAAKGVYLPAGTYRVSSITMPDGLAVFGAGVGRAWLKGHLAFGSNELISDLKIGDAGKSAVHNKAGAAGSVFARVHFRGGGGAGWHAPVILLGGGGSCSNITFRHCEVERNVGIEDSSLTNCYNDITVYESRNAHVSDISFDGCHVGVTNGVATGSPRMDIECWTAPGSGIGWHNITVRGCEFEPSTLQNLDLACSPDSGRATGVMIEGCIFHGASPTGQTLGHAIDLEFPADVTIQNNDFHRCTRSVISCDHQTFTDLDTHWHITGNTFDCDTAEQGITAVWGLISINTANNVITGNTFNVHTTIAPSCVEFSTAAATGNILTGNAFNLNGAQVVASEVSGATNNGSATWLTANAMIRQ